MRERELNLIDLIVEILLGWRMIVVWMLVGGLAMGGLSYVRSAWSASALKEAREAEKNELKTLAQYEEALTLMQKNNVQAVLFYENAVDYYNHSPLLQIDAASVPKTEMTFFVKADSLEKSCSIECWYEAALSSGLVQWLEENNLNQTDIDLRELITVTSSERTEMGCNSFTLQIIHLTEKECFELADQVEHYINFLHAQFSANVDVHDIILVNRSYASAMDTELLGRQRTLFTNIVATNIETDKLIKAFSAEEARYYECLKKEQVSEENGVEGPESSDNFTHPDEQSIPASKPSVSVKYIFLGMILFAFIYVFYLFLKFILRNKLSITDDIREIYDIPQLGSIPANISNKKFLGVVDKWIIKLRDSNKRTFSVEDATGLATVAVKIAAQKENVTEVFCIGCNVTDRTRKIAEQLQDTLKKENIKLNILNNVLYDQEALEKLATAKCVFLLETAGGTFYEEIEKELELLARQEIKVLGGIIVG